MGQIADLAQRIADQLPRAAVGVPPSPPVVEAAEAGVEVHAAEVAAAAEGAGGGFVTEAAHAAAAAAQGAAVAQLDAKLDAIVAMLGRMAPAP